MAGLDVNTKSFSQFPESGNLKDTDVLVIAQKWAPGGNGYKTVNINLRVGFETIADAIKDTGIPPELIDVNGGVIGTGSKTDPLRISQQWVSEHYAIAALANVSQVGRLDRTSLPLGNAPTAFSFPMNGRSFATFAAPVDETNFNTLVPVTDGFNTSYNYGSGEMIGNDMVDYTTSEEPYMPKLPDGFDPANYRVEQIFSCSKFYMVIKLRHVTDSNLDELAVVATNGSMDGAYHTTFFLASKNLYLNSVGGNFTAGYLESKMKYTAFEQDGKLYLTRFDINSQDKSFGDKPERNIALNVYQLVGLSASEGYRLTPVLVRDITTKFLGKTLTGGSSTTLTEGYFGKGAAELDLSIVDKTALEYRSLDMSGLSQSLDRYLDVNQTVDGKVTLRLNRTADFFVTRANGSRQHFIVNYAFTYNVDMVNKVITAVEQDPVKYRPKLILSGTIYSVAMNKQEATLWNGATGRIETRSENNLTITSPTTASGECLVTQRDSVTGAPLVSGTIQTVDTSNASISPDQYSVPLGTNNLGDNQDLMFVSGSEDNGYRIGGLKITGADSPNYQYTNAKGEAMHGYSLDLERFNEQRFVDGVNLDSYSVVYNCRTGKIFTDLSGYYDTTSRTRFGIAQLTVDELKNTMSKSFVQREVSLVFPEGNNKPDVDTTDIDVFVEHDALGQWVSANLGYVDSGFIKVVPFKIGEQGKVFVHMSLVGGIGVGLITAHLIADAVLNDEDVIIGAVDESSVVINTVAYNGALKPVYEQPDLYNVSIFIEEESSKVVILYGNFGEHSYSQPSPANRAYMLGFNSRAELRDLPYNSNFGLVTYYLDKVAGISFTAKDSWLQIIHTSEQIDLAGAVPMMLRSEPMLLAAPAAAGIGTISVLEPIPFFLGGVNGTIPPQNVTIPKQVEGIVIQYLYLGLRNGEPYLEFLGGGTMERTDYTLIAVVNTASGITISSEPFIRLGNFRLSTTKKGSAIPVTAPRPDIEQFTLWD